MYALKTYGLDIERDRYSAFAHLLVSSHVGAVFSSAVGFSMAPALFFTDRFVQRLMRCRCRCRCKLSLADRRHIPHQGLKTGDFLPRALPKRNEDRRSDPARPIQTVDELEAAFREAVDDYLETCARLGDKPNRPYSGKLTLRIPPSVHAAIATAAETSNKSLNRWVADILNEAKRDH